MSSNFLHHEPCPSCGSKDNLARYEDGGAHCFSQGCNYHEFAGSTIKEPQGVTMANTHKAELMGVVSDITDRRISQATCRKFNVHVEYGNDGTISKHHYPVYGLDGALTGVKTRVCGNKDFYVKGSLQAPTLFGQSTCKGKGKYITITEGEIDALSVSEMFDRKWDVVSLKNGASNAAKEIKQALEFLEGYDHVVLCFDQDAAGKKAVDSVKDLFSPNKLLICKLPRKDASEMLVNKEVQKFTRAWWDAKKYTPAGIVNVSETWQDVLDYKNTPSTPYPWGGLNDILMGQRAQEIVVWAADTGIGKSQMMRELQYDTIQRTGKKVGVLMLEESVAKTTLGWMSFIAGRPLHKELDTITEEELRGYWNEVVKDDKFVLLDHRGWENDMEKLKARIRFMKHVEGCDIIYLDHLHLALSSVKGATGDWSGIDELMTDFRSLVHDLDITLHLVCHTSGDRNLRGSKGISKIADAVIYLERDKHNEDPEIANTTSVVVDKNRWAGDVGTACYLRYDRSNGRMVETSKPDEGAQEDEF